MKRFTEKYIRAANQWVKITRDNENRSFCFARGYADEYTAHDIQTLPFKWVANWTEAVAHAERMINSY